MTERHSRAGIAALIGSLVFTASVGLMGLISEGLHGVGLANPSPPSYLPSLTDILRGGATGIGVVVGGVLGVPRRVRRAAALRDFKAPFICSAAGACPAPGAGSVAQLTSTVTVNICGGLQDNASPQVYRTALTLA